MTPEEIDNLQPGWELDTLIAEKVMGYDWSVSDLRHMPNFHPSTDIADAWAVVEKTRMFKLYHATLNQYDDSWAIDNPTLGWWVEADTAPLAICRAALKALADEQEDAK